MDFIKRIENWVKESLSQKNLATDEEKTKQALIRPFIGDVLGYNVRNLQEVLPEFDAKSPNTPKDKKVDYAIFIDGSPTIIFECKKLGSDLGYKEWDQLSGYFVSLLEVRFGVLTNGLRYQFYTDLENKNLMDNKPFLEFDLSNIQEPLVEELQRFSKANFNASIIRSKAEEKAEELKYTQKIKDLLAKEYKNTPTKEFARFCMKGIGYEPEGRKTSSKEIEKFRGFVKQAFHEFVSEHSASAGIAESDNEPVVPEPSTPQVSDERGWQPLSEISPQASDPKPTNILFPDNSQVPIKTWRAILVEIARWLKDEKLLGADHCPLLSSDSATRYIISTDPKHSDDKPFTEKEKIGPLYIEKNAGRSIIVNNTRRIIEHVGQDPAQFKVSFPV